MFTYAAKKTIQSLWRWQFGGIEIESVLELFSFIILVCPYVALMPWVRNCNINSDENERTDILGDMQTLGW